MRRDAPPSYDTPSRAASLSRQLDNFFTAWIQWLLQSESRTVYAVYSGGDDLPLVAPRRDCLTLAKRLREAFVGYTRNPELTLSAGLAVVKPRLPIAHTARQADEALEAAKEAGRDRIALLGAVLPWADLPVFEESVGVLARAEVPSAFLYQLLNFAGLWKAFRRGQVHGLRFQPLLTYTLGHNVDRKRQPELFDWGSRLVGFPLPPAETKEAKVMDNLGVIAQWAILERRER